MPRVIQLVFILTLVCTLCGCSKSVRTKEVTYGHVTTCKECGYAMEQCLYKRQVPIRDADKYAIVQNYSCCEKCADRLVEVKTGTVTKCEDCGQLIKSQVRVIKVKFRESSSHSVIERYALCGACKRARRPLPYTVVSTSDASFGDYGNTPGKSRTVYRVRLDVQKVPTEKQMRSTAESIWKSKRGKTQELFIFLYLPGMHIENVAYGVAECDSSGISFRVQDFALMGTQWER